ncbi:hypothetical protein [Tropicimonas marinistellae]|uniref:hypothetical protein n=1 Tax=Tropicimonas marinistellae TaxID=1739787 RepID=UPI0008314258|nr:hypothetical protein [Tropicimonas marinistellae]
MEMDSALNAQIEILTDIFGFEARAELGQGAAALVDPDFEAIEAQSAAPAVFAEATAAAVPLVGRRSASSVRKSIGKPQKKDSDDIALGIGPTGSDGNGYKVVALYQKPGLTDQPTLRALKDKLGDEIDIRYGGRVRALAGWHYQRSDPMRLGSSCGHKRVTAGTLGCFAKDLDTDKLGILSNNHVLADVNAAAIGDEILQPGPADSGLIGDTVARLARFVPIRFAGVPNSMDCAWAELDSPRATELADIYDSADQNVGTLSQTNPVRLSLGDYVLKTGRTTGYSQGEVTLVNVTNLNVGMGADLTARFDGVIQIESLSKTPFSDGGDSGSLILNDRHQPGALLFAGSSSGGAFNQGTTFACDLELTLQALNIEIVM